MTPSNGCNSVQCVQGTTYEVAVVHVRVSCCGRTKVVPGSYQGRIYAKVVPRSYSLIFVWNQQNTEECCTKVVSRSYRVEFLIPPLSGSVVHEELRSLISIRMASLGWTLARVGPPAGGVRSPEDT